MLSPFPLVLIAAARNLLRRLRRALAGQHTTDEETDRG